MLEDSADDAVMVDREMKRGGFRVNLTRVAGGKSFLDELQKHPPDLVFSDHGVPSFDGFAALATVRNRSPDLPFIFVTGTLGEEGVIRAFENGATDCVLKHRLSGLAPAVKRALNRAGRNRHHSDAEPELRRLRQEIARLQERVSVFDEIMTVCSACRKVRAEPDEWRSLEVHLNRRLGLTFSHGMCPDCMQKYYTGYV